MSLNSYNETSSLRFRWFYCWFEAEGAAYLKPKPKAIILSKGHNIFLYFSEKSSSECDLGAEQEQLYKWDADVWFYERTEQSIQCAAMREGLSFVINQDDDASFYRTKSVQTLLHMAGKLSGSQSEFKFMVEMKNKWAMKRLHPAKLISQLL